MPRFVPRLGRLLAALAVAGLMGFLAARLPTPWLLVEPGLAVPVPVQVVRPPGTRPVVTTPFWLVTVAARPARLGDAWTVLRDPGRSLVTARALGGGSLDEVMAAQRAALAASKEAAAAAAAELMGVEPGAVAGFPLPPAIAGPSGGLAMGLAAVDALAPGDLAGGRRVGATGTLSPDGRVGPVEGVEQKWRAAAMAGLDVLFVPARGPGPAPGSAPMVVRVPSLAAAVAWLCQQGGQGPPCD
ncbi:hypothetical protein DYI95_004680 [Thermaerobacter sp. PB12/4term]|nr:hypothetical protein DYI95_004680 [Thermaerobacter sp. PB12/4term]